MAIEYYVMRRNKRGTDTKVKTCETSEQALKFIRDMPIAKERAEHFVQYSPDAVAAYNERRMADV